MVYVSDLCECVGFVCVVAYGFARVFGMIGW